MQETSITATVDFDKDGIQHGFLKLPHSHDDSAWGCIMIPVTVVKNGSGPTALLTGGNHGDEYEGITALLKLARFLEPGDIQGRVIIIPMMNHPAVVNGTRTSPIDNGNMNRSFPGHPYGSLTERIADYFTRYLIPLCDCALDIHSGGNTLDIIPFSAVHKLPDPHQQQRCIEAAMAFGTPHTVLMHELDATTLYDTAVEQQGKIFVTTELGGGGTSSPKSVAYAEQGCRNFLSYFGILSTPPLQDPECRLLDMPDDSCYIQSEHSGILEFFFSLGDEIEKGQAVAQIHSIERTGEAAIVYRANRSGILAARRHPAKVNIGDTFVVLAVPSSIAF